MPSYITATPETSKSILKNAEYFAPPPKELRIRVIRDHYEGSSRRFGIVIVAFGVG